MMRRTSGLTRSIRTLTALVTVWCLGCSAFDPLIESLLPGDHPTMVCASEAPSTVQLVKQEGGSIGAPANRDANDGASCGCGFCSAPAPTELVSSVPAPMVPQQPGLDAITPASVARTPLLPPPQPVA
ncbi:MAG TPA: hypothetical protein VMZ22_02650 [Acidimicrobiales bacterium]|nr:hypothetical protein [Acidimicrobiales bacterium]